MYLSGIITARKNKLISQHPEEQFHDAFYKLGVYLETAGLTYENILEITTFHIDLKKHTGLFSKVKDRYIKALYPAWTTIGVSEFIPESALVEMRTAVKLKVVQFDNGDLFLISAQRVDLAPTRSVYSILLKNAAVCGLLGVLEIRPDLPSS